MPRLTPPDDREPGFKFDPATGGRYHRWWSGDEWADATRPVGGPTLSEIGHDVRASADVAGVGLAPMTRRALAAVGIGIVVALLGVRMLTPGALEYIEPSQIVAGWVLIAVGALTAQAGLVGFVIGGFGYGDPSHDVAAPAVGRGDPDVTAS